MTEPKFLTLEQVLEIHRVQLELFGGQAGIRDQSALESAIAQPEAGEFPADRSHGLRRAHTPAPFYRLQKMHCKNFLVLVVFLVYSLRRCSGS